jgi:CheY-like chemotaxis protein
MVETILVVDDDAGSRELLGAILTDGGYLVAQAENGLGALGQGRRASPSSW